MLEIDPARYSVLKLVSLGEFSSLLGPTVVFLLACLVLFNWLLMFDRLIFVTENFMLVRTDDDIVDLKAT